MANRVERRSPRLDELCWLAETRTGFAIAVLHGDDLAQQVDQFCVREYAAWSPGLDPA
jgi:hypothetical protein